MVIRLIYFTKLFLSILKTCENLVNYFKQDLFDCQKFIYKSIYSVTPKTLDTSFLPLARIDPLDFTPYPLPL